MLILEKQKGKKLNTPLKKLEDKNDRINHKKVKKEGNNKFKSRNL